MEEAGTWKKRSGEGGSFTSRARILRLRGDDRDQSAVFRQSRPTHELVHEPEPQRNSHFPPAHELVQVAPSAHCMVQPPPEQSNLQVAPASQKKVHFPPVQDDSHSDPTSHLVEHPPFVQEKSQPDWPRAQVSVGAVAPLSGPGLVEVLLPVVDPVGEVPPSVLPTVQS